MGPMPACRTRTWCSAGWSARPVSILCAVLACAAHPASAAPPPARPGAPLSSHAMVYTCCTPLAMKERIFAESRAMGARFIRVDVELKAIFPSFGLGAGAPDWARLDEVMRLSQRYELPVLGILRTPPDWVAPHEAQEFGRLAGQVAAQARDTITRWEIINEPNASWGFEGTPEQYARVLRASYDAIAAAAPQAEVVLGGVMAPGGPEWLERVFATPGADAARAFDIAAINLRETPRRLPGRVAAWRGLFARHGFTGPLWITEHGYPADPAFQTDSAFRGGEASQAVYLTESILHLAEGGAGEVFVTLRDDVFLRDTFFDQFLSEGVVAIGGEPDYPVRRKPAFAAMRRLVDHWDALIAAHLERRFHEESMRLAIRRAAAAARNVEAQRTRLRAARARLKRVQSRYRRLRSTAARLGLREPLRRRTVQLRRRRNGVGWAKASLRDYRFKTVFHERRAADLTAFLAGR
jgi:hypothetical protein